jgi:hypothetical protein
MGHLGAMVGALIGAAIAHGAYHTVMGSLTGAVIGAVVLGAIAVYLDATKGMSCGPWNSRRRLAHNHVKHLDPRIHRDAR